MDRFTQSLLGQGDYADAGMILPLARAPDGELMLSFPQSVQGLGRTVGRATGLLPMEYDAETGLPSEDILMDAFDAAGSFTGAGLLAPRPANSLGMGGRIEDMPLFQQIGKRPMSRALPPAEQALCEGWRGHAVAARERRRTFAAAARLRPWRGAGSRA